MADMSGSKYYNINAACLDNVNIDELMQQPVQTSEEDSNVQMSLQGDGGRLVMHQLEHEAISLTRYYVVNGHKPGICRSLSQCSFRAHLPLLAAPISKPETGRSFRKYYELAVRLFVGLSCHN